MGPTHRSLQRTLFPRGRFSSYSFSFRIVTDWELERKNFVFFLLSQGEGKLRRELAISQGGLKTSGEEGSRPGHRWQMSAYRWRVGPEWYSGYLFRIPQGWESIWGTVSDHFTLFFFWMNRHPLAFCIPSMLVAWRSAVCFPSGTSSWFPGWKRTDSLEGLFGNLISQCISSLQEFFITLQNKELDQSWLVYVERILIW